MKRTLALGVALVLLAVTPALGATKAPVSHLTLVPLTPSVMTNFSGGDEVAQLLSNSTNIFLLGTVETTTSPLVTATPLGGSDGFLVALDGRGAHSWDLRLGGAGDDVATAGFIDALGNIWIAGASALPTATPSPGLNQIDIWEISPAGLLENTYSKSVADVDIPTSISQKGLNFILAGSSSKPGFPTFVASLTPLGKIGVPKNLTTPVAAAPALFAVSSAAYIWQNFVTTQGIKGVTGIPLHQSTTLLTDSSLKAKTLKSVYSIQGAPLALLYQVGIGVVSLSQSPSTYFLTIIHTK